MGIFDKFKNRTKKTKEKFSEYQDAIAFTETNTQEDAVNLLEETQNLADAPPKLLVVGQGNSFTSDVVDYAIDMAKRLGYSIVALNAVPIGDDLPVKSIERKRLRDEFKQECEKAAASFKQKATEAGIEFSHVVKFLDKDDALEEIKREIPSIEFVISASEKEYVCPKDEQRVPNRPGVCVYSIV